MIFAMILFNMFMLILKKLQKLNKSITIVEIMLSRGIFQTLVSFTMIILLKVSFKTLTRPQIKLLAMRSILSMFSMYTLWFGLFFLPIGLHSSMQNLSPIITLLFAYIFIGEKMKTIEIANIFCCFLGVILVLTFA